MVVALGLSGGAPASAQQGRDMRAEAETVLQRLTGELSRIRGYLAYYDQINRIAVAQGRMAPQDADTRVRQKAGELLRKSFGDAELAPLLAQHREHVRAWLVLIRQHVDASSRWPNGARPESYRPLAQNRLDGLQRDYETWMERRLDPLPLLEEAVKVFAWTQGHEQPPAGFNPFAGHRERVIRALPDGVAQAILEALDQGRAPAEAAVAALDRPAIVASPGPGPLPGMTVPPPVPTARPLTPAIVPTTPAIVPPPVPSIAVVPPPALPGYRVLPEGAECTHRLSPAIHAKWTQLGGQGGVLGCPIKPEGPAAQSPHGTTGTAAEFALGDGGMIVLHATGGRAGQAYEVHGCNFKLYRQLGGSSGVLGFPVSDEHDAPGGRRSDFEGGYIHWTAATRVCTAYRHDRPPQSGAATTGAASAPRSEPAVAHTPPSRAASAQRIRVNDQSFEQRVLRASGPTVLVFCASWSIDCVKLSPTLDELAAEMAGKLVVADLDLHESPNTMKRYLKDDARIPTLMVFKDGRVIATKIGAATKNELYGWATTSTGTAR